MFKSSLASVGFSLLALGLGAAGAEAQTASRAWVSGHGVDQAGCAQPTNPCRTIQYALQNIVAAGGEIDVLDPAGYGPITITKAISIVNDGVGTAGIIATSGGNGITINAGATDAIFLRGLTVEGGNTGAAGLFFNTGARLVVANSVFRNFTDHGIKLAPSGQTTFVISDTIASDNGSNGVDISPVGSGSASGTIVGLHATGNGQLGMAVDGTHLTSPVNSTIGVQGSVFSGNGQYGLGVQSSTMTVVVDRSSANGNPTGGFASQLNGVLYLSRSEATGNGTGITTSGTIFSYGNNSVIANGTDVSGTVSTVTAH